MQDSHSDGSFSFHFVSFGAAACFLKWISNARQGAPVYSLFTWTTRYEYARRSETYCSSWTAITLTYIAQTNNPLFDTVYVPQILRFFLGC